MSPIITPSQIAAERVQAVRVTAENILGNAGGGGGGGGSVTTLWETDWLPDTDPGIPAPSTGGAWSFPVGGAATDYKTSGGELFHLSGATAAPAVSAFAEALPAGGFALHTIVGSNPGFLAFPIVDASFNGYEVNYSSGWIIKRLAGGSPVANLDTYAGSATAGETLDFILKPNVQEVWIDGVKQLESTDTNYYAALALLGVSVIVDAGGTRSVMPITVDSDLTPQ